MAGKPTRHVYLKGKWVLETYKVEEGNGEDTKEVNLYKNVTIDSITVFDEKGVSHKVSLEFKCTDNMPPTGGLDWSLIEVKIDGMNLWTFSEQTIQFSTTDNGSARDEHMPISAYRSQRGRKSLFIWVDAWVM